MEERELLKSIITSFKGKKGELIPLLHAIQSKLGYISEIAMELVAKFLKIPESEVYSVASFYTQFRLTPLGRKRVAVCRGTACHIHGSSKILKEIENLLGLKEGETSDDLEYTLETVACIGCCAIAPCIRINKEVYGQLTQQKVKDLFSPINREKEDA
jgi:NADH-quinone oxidoreductase subunit E